MARKVNRTPGQVHPWRYEGGVVVDRQGCPVATVVNPADGPIVAAAHGLLAYIECNEALHRYEATGILFEEVETVLRRHGYNGLIDPDTRLWVESLKQRALATARGGTA